METGASRERARLRRLAGIAALAAAYAATGELGLQLAIPPGYATALWPPSGIALAALLIWGLRLWPGVALGSFLLNLSTTLQGSPAFALGPALAVPAAIGAGAALQAVAGAILIRRSDQWSGALAEPADIGRLFLLGGMAACLINPTIAIAALHLAGRLPAANLAYNWATWWAGDITGVCIFAPLTLVWCRPQAAQRGRRAVLASLAILVTFGLTAAAEGFALDVERSNLAGLVDDACDRLVAALDKSVRSHVEAVGAVESLYSSLDSVEPEQFRLFASHIRARFDSIAALEWIARVPLAERQSFETGMRSKGLQSFTIRASEPPQTGADQALHDLFPVTFVEPVNGNQRAVGFDLGSDASRRAMLSESQDSGRVVITAPIRLVQDGRRAVLAAIPIYRNDLPHESREQRRIALKGFAVGVIRLPDLIATAFAGTDIAGLHYWLEDRTAPDHPAPLSANSDEPPAGLQLNDGGLFGSHATLQGEGSLVAGGRTWVLRVAPTLGFVGRHYSHDAWLVLLGGLCFSSAAGAFVLILTGREQSLSALVEDRTRRYQDLLAASAEVEGLAKQQAARFQALLKTASDGIHVLDTEGNLVEASESFLRMLGYAGDEAPASVTDWEAGHTPEVLFGEFLPSLFVRPQVFETRQRRRDGSLIEVEVNARPVELDGRQYLYASSRDITERKHIEATLRYNEELAKTLMNATADAAFLMDRDGIILAANGALAARFGMTPQGIVGQSIFALVTPGLAKVRRGECAQVLASGVPLHVQDERGGLILDNRLYPINQADGAVTQIAVFSRDVTDQRLAERRLEESEEQFRSTFEQAAVGIVHTALDGRFLRCNRRFSEIVGYSQDEVMGLSFRQITHRDDMEESEDEVRRLMTGEIDSAVWEKRYLRKNGATVWVRLTVALQRDRTGSPLHFITVIEDIDAQRRTQLLLAARWRLTNLAASASLRELLVATLDEACQLTGSTVGFYHFLLPDQATLSLQAWSTRTTAEFCHAQAEASHYDIAEAGIWADSIRLRQAVTYNDYPSAEGRRGLPPGHAEIQRMISVPVLRDTFVTAVLGVGNKPTDFDEADQQIVLSLADMAWDIAERKRAEERLKESEDRFRSLVEETTDWAWETDVHHRVAWVSPGFEITTGVSPAELTGKHRWQFASETQEIDTARWQRHIEDLAAHRSFRDFRYWFRSRLGQDQWFSISGTPRFDASGNFLGYRGTGSDITAKAAIALRLRTLSAVVDQSPVSVLITDRNGVITYVNGHFSTVTGYSAAEVLGQNPRILASGETPPSVYEELWSMIKAGRTWVGELRNRRKDGSLYWGQAAIFPVTNDEGDTVHYVSLKEDITSRKEAVARLAAQVSLTRHHYESLRALNDIAALPQADAARQLTEALLVGARHLDLPTGIISRIAGQRYTVLHQVSPAESGLADGQSFELGQTYCSITVEAQDVVAIPHMQEAAFSGHPCYQAFGLETYIGAPVSVRGAPYGTVNFSSPRPYRRDFDGADIEFVRLLARWIGTVLERALAEDELQLMARSDPLTGLANRRAFVDAARAEFERHKRFGVPAALLMIDVDHFKEVNDRRGHDAGDNALVALASLLSTTVRATDLPARFGGEEFTVLLVGTDLAGAMEMAERIREATTRIKVASPTGAFSFTVSIGATVFASTDENWSVALRRADAALYQAKSSGRNRVVEVAPAGDRPNA